MQPEYGNWIPRKMIVSFSCITVVFLGVALTFALSGIVSHAVLRWILFGVFSLLFLICLFITIWSISARCAFPYNGKRRLSMQIVEGGAIGVGGYIIANGKKILDVAKKVKGRYVPTDYHYLLSDCKGCHRLLSGRI